jgi:hypothetical protein
VNEASQIEVHIVNSTEPPGDIGETGTSAIFPAIANDLRCDRQAPTQDAGRPPSVEGGLTGSRAAIS